ncbi:CHAT domain-containing tetratricopeptide repeat protein [uncultured Flavobacterium sp.]|uniref:CHAT domain-containing protein n=1 Tax=uncultured Flavobacterium sp. TaxID=165435 RepID=UPI0030C887EF
MIKKIIFFTLLWSSVSLAQNNREEDFSAAFNTGLHSIENEDIANGIKNLELAYKYGITAYGESSIQVGQVCYYLAVLYADVNPTKALGNSIKATTIFKNQYGEKSEEYVLILSILGGVYLDLKQFEKAKNTYLESQSLAKEIYGENSIEYGVTLTNIAGAFLKVAEFNMALRYVTEGLDILKKQPTFPEVYYNNLRYNNLPFIYEGLGRFDEALAVYEESLNYIKKQYGSNNVNYAHILQSIGMIQLKIGALVKAEKSLQKSVEILSTAEDNKFDASLANAYMGLAVYYTKVYDYESAINYSNLALEINQRLEANNLEYDVTYYDILSSLYYEIGNTSFAKNLSEKAKNKSKEVYGENSLEYANKLSNYAYLLWFFDENESKKLSYQALAIAEKIDKKSPQYQACLENLIPILIKDDKIDEAITIVKNSAFNSDTSSAVYWENNLLLGNLYLIHKKYTEAEKTLFETLKGIEKIYGKNSPKYATVLENYIESLFLQKKYANLPSLIKECNVILVNQVKDFFKFASEKPKNTYLTTLEKSFNFFQKVGYTLKDDKELALLNYENQLLLKGLLLNTSKDLVTKLSDLNNSQVDELINLYLQKKNEFVKNNVLQKEDAKGLNMEIINLENELTDLYNSNFKTDYSNQFKKSFKTVQANLKSDEVAVEFSKIDISDFNDENSNFVYVAYLIKKENNYPELVIIGDEETIKNLLKESKLNPNETFNTRGSTASKIGPKLGAKELYKVIWKPLETYIIPQSTVYFALDGILHQVPMALLTNEANLMLIENYHLVQLNNTFDLTTKKVEPKLNNTLFIGGVKYDYDINKNINVKNENSKEGIKFENQSDKQSWSYLPATLSEIKSIQLLFKKNNVSYQSLTDSMATEDTIKAIESKSPSVIHIATHGFFFPNSEKNNANSVLKDNIFKFSDDPLLRSGLLFYGANYAWVNGSNPYEEEDGILTALEISNLDLHATDLVILSACETGLGDVNGSEGVYGLQRAFKKAGVSKIIMSLWQVPDKETAEFMELLYTNWFSGLSLKESFRKTQLEMSKKYREEPLKWAAFFLLE